MHIGKSIKMAMNKKGMVNQDLADKLGRTLPSVSVMRGRETCSGQTMIELARIFDMKVSELIALGEE